MKKKSKIKVLPDMGTHNALDNSKVSLNY